MTVNHTTFTDWARKPSSDLRRYNRSSPNLLAIRDDLIARFPGTASLGIYGVRDARGHDGVKSVHSFGAALDLSYRGPGRAVGQAVIDFLIAWSHELGVQAVHDYLGGAIWRSWRPSQSGGGGWKAQAASPSTGMGQQWADWLHIEVTEESWSTDRPVNARIGEPVPAIPYRPRIGLGSRGDLVRVAQTIILERAGQDIGPIDGQFGLRTLAGWQNVAAWCKWPIDQDISGDDWALLAWIDQGWARLNAVGVS